MGEAPSTALVAALQSILKARVVERRPEHVGEALEALLDPHGEVRGLAAIAQKLVGQVEQREDRHPERRLYALVAGDFAHAGVDEISHLAAIIGVGRTADPVLAAKDG